MKKTLLISFLFLLNFFILETFGQDLTKMSTQFYEQFKNTRSNEKIGCLIEMNDALPLEKTRSLSNAEKVKELSAFSRKSQELIMTWLSSKNVSVNPDQIFWILNGFYIETTTDIVSEISEREDVKKIYANEIRTIDLPVSEKFDNDERAVEWGVSKIKADLCWAAGYTGKDVVIGILDTGVDFDHPSLVGKWTGHFKAATGLPQQTEPYDDQGHGTHCCGTILGGDGLGSGTNDIGVAPDAKYVAAKVLSSSGGGSDAQIIEGLQFMADLKATVDIKLLSMSVGGSSQNDAYFEIFKSLNSLGFVLVMANGNSGPGEGTVNTPACYGNAIGVGNTTNTDAINSSSSRGPTENKAPFNDNQYWLRNDWNYIKPNISAPGTDIRSASANSTGYTLLTGTSMACPHVAGAIALLFSKNPNLTISQIYDLVVDNADKPSAGGTYPNNNYGWGLINIKKALDNVPEPNTPPVANFSSDVSSTCTGIVKFSDKSTSGPTSWLWEFGDGTTSTLQNPSHTYSTNNTYTVKLTATNSFGFDTTTKTSFISVNRPPAPVTTGSSSNSPGTLTLSATGTGTLKWYDTETGGNLLSTGNTFTTPFINATTSYYVQNEESPAEQSVGLTQKSSDGAYYTSTSRWGLVFNALVPLTIKSVKVYANSSENRTIWVKGSTFSDSVTVNIPTGEQTVNLNFNIPVGTGYILGGTSACNLWRDASGATYPYSIPNIISITGNTASSAPNYYYYFYDWKISGSPCISTRTPVTAIIDPTIGIIDNNKSSIKIYPNPADHFIQLKTENPISDNDEIEITDLLGQVLLKENLVSELQTLNIKSFSKGIYIIKVKQAESVYCQKIIVE